MNKKGEIIQNEKNIKQIEQQVKENENKIDVLNKDLNSYASDTDEKINSLTADLNGLQSDRIFNAKCTFENNNYTLTLNENDLKPMPQYFTIRFKAPNNYVEGSGFFIGNLCYTPKNANFEYGDVVTAEFEYLGMEGHCFFKSGGGGITETLPPQIENFNAIADNGLIEVSWTISDATYLNGYVFVVKENEAPKNVNDGIKYEIGKDMNVAVIDGLKNNVLYYIRCFPYNTKKQYQTEYMAVYATPIEKVELKDLPIGSKVKDLGSKCDNEVISWIIADKNHDGYPSNSVTLISEKIFGQVMFDGKEPNNPDKDRKIKGNNRYSVSNIRQWLNSDKENWFSKQHEYDEPQSYDNFADFRPTCVEKGFMCNLSNNFKNNILPTNLTVVKPKIDGDGSEVVTDKVFLLSVTEIGGKDENNIAEGSKLALFSDDESRKIGSRYCLRTPDPYDFNSVYVYSVDGRGRVGGGVLACSSYCGALPVSNLKSDIMVSENPDSDGCYILKL